MPPPSLLLYLCLPTSVSLHLPPSQVTDKKKNPTRFVYFRDLAQQTVEQMNNCLKTLLEAYTLVRNNIETSGGYGLGIFHESLHMLCEPYMINRYSVSRCIFTL